MIRLRSWWQSFFNGVRLTIDTLASRPKRAAFMGIVGAGLVWLVLSSTLPYVLAQDSPEAALRLSTEHPVALLSRAKQLRTELLSLSEEKELLDREEYTSAAENNGTAAKHAAPRLTMSEADAKKAEIRGQIRSLATRVIKSDPLNATAFRLLAEVTEDASRVRALMQAAVKRSRRETIALFWLLNDSYYRKDWALVLEYADILLRTKVQLAPYVVSYLGQMAEDPNGRALLQEQLATSPSWRRVLFNEIPRRVSDVNTPLIIMIALKDAGSAPTDEELRPYLDFLISKERVDLAYNAWLQLMPDDELETLGLLQNAGFDHEPTGLPFDWRISRPRNAVIGFEPLEGRTDDQALHISFGVGRVRFPETSQTLALAPGDYRFKGLFRGKIDAKRGLRWQIRCVGRTRNVLAETEMLIGQFKEWKDFRFEFSVPNDAGCKGQVLRLFHESRSASEELISGDVWFNNLQLERSNTLN